MAYETHKLQTEPPEGSREVINHELERQSKNKKADDGASRAKRPREARPNKAGAPKES
jgi:hypothetical protein